MLVRRNRQTNNVAKAVRLASRTSYGMEISQDNGLILINMNLKSIKTEKTEKTMETMEKEHREKMIEMAILLSTLATLVVMFVMVFGVVMLAMR